MKAALARLPSEATSDAYVASPFRISADLLAQISGTAYQGFDQSVPRPCITYGARSALRAGSRTRRGSVIASSASPSRGDERT
jgi:hypothetical protein